MQSNIQKIQLNTAIGSFDFKEHFCSSADPYEAMCLFEANNWKKLGTTSYEVFLKWDDETGSTEKFTGINASAHLSQFIEEYNQG